MSRVLGGIAVLAGGALLALAWEASTRAMHPAAARIAWGLDDYPRLRAHAIELRIPSRTGITLAGRLFPARNGATIVLSHGYGGTQDEMLPVADALHRRGFGVLTYDLRGCGRSGGHVTFGALEQDDLRSVVDHAVERDDVDPRRIGALGFSMGAATTVMAAARDKRIRAVVDDSGWARVEHWLRPRLAPLSRKLLELRTGEDLGELRPQERVARLSPRPLLLIHGGADAVVPPADAAANFAAAREPKALWEVPGAAHGDTVGPGGAASSDRVADFFAEALSA